MNNRLKAIVNRQMPNGDDISLVMNITPGDEYDAIHQLENVLCQVKETLKVLEVKQKTWDQKEVNLEAQPEQESSTPSNDQRLPEKEQSQRTVKTNKQYIISYPVKQTKCLDTGAIVHNCDIAETVLESLQEGKNAAIPNDWKVQVIDL